MSRYWQQPAAMADLQYCNCVLARDKWAEVAAYQVTMLVFPKTADVGLPDQLRYKWKELLGVREIKMSWELLYF